MKLGIMQPYFFPYIGYWQLINAVDVYIVYDDVNYNTFSAFHGKYNVDETPVARSIGNRILCLPIYADLEMETVDRICDIILSGGEGNNL